MKDDGARREHQSAEYGSLKKGQTRSFSTADQLLVSGAVTKAVAADITCLEADASNGDGMQNFARLLLMLPSTVWMLRLMRRL